MKTSDNGISLIRSFEGFRAEPYADVGGKMTVGYGHLIKQGEMFTTISEDDASALLAKDLHYAESCVNTCVTVALNQNQFDSLVSFVFNLGTGSFENSTLLKDINDGNFDAAANEFLRWVHCDGQVIDGLVHRRQAESNLFQTPVDA